MHMWAVKARLKQNLQLDGVCILVGYEMTLTKGIKEYYYLWHNTGLYNIPKNCVGDIVKQISDN